MVLVAFAIPYSLGFALLPYSTNQGQRTLPHIALSIRRNSWILRILNELELQTLRVADVTTRWRSRYELVMFLGQIVAKSNQDRAISFRVAGASDS